MALISILMLFQYVGLPLSVLNLYNGHCHCLCCVLDIGSWECAKKQRGGCEPDAFAGWLANAIELGLSLG